MSLRLLKLITILLLLVPAAGLRAQVTALTSSGTVSGATLDVYFLDVGQGNCVVIRTPAGKYMLYDAGSTSSWIDKNAIAGQISKITGGNDITTIILSHPDADHINIIPYIKEAKKPLYVHFSGVVSDYDSELSTWLKQLPSNTDSVTYKTYYSSTSPSSRVDVGKGTDVYILAANVPGDANTKSIVTSIDYGGNTVLLTGDATATTERWIMQNWNSSALQATVFSFGHHGSDHSNSKAFLDAVNPRVGIFSASAMHKGYGHPRCILVDYVETLVDEDGQKGVTVAKHRIDCWNKSQKQYVTEENDIGVFLTATQGIIVFSCDVTDYKVLVQKLK